MTLLVGCIDVPVRVAGGRIVPNEKAAQANYMRAYDAALAALPEDIVDQMARHKADPAANPWPDLKEAFTYRIVVDQ
jgi:hypothetical protein